MTNFELVKLFYEEFVSEHTKHTKPNIFSVPFENYDMVQSKLDEITEQVEKLKMAKDDDEFIEMINYICNIMYCVYGTFYVFGVNFDEQLEKQSKLVDNLKLLIDTSIFNNFVSEDLSHLLKKIDEKSKSFDSPINYSDIFKYDSGRLGRQFTMLEQYLSLLNEACEDFDTNSVLVYLQKIEIQCRSLANMLGVENIDLCFRELHRANMSKGCETEEIAQKSVQYYIDQNNTQSDKSSTTPTYRFSKLTNLWIVYNEATMTILDSVNKHNPDYVKILDFNNIKNLEKLTESTE